MHVSYVSIMDWLMWSAVYSMKWKFVQFPQATPLLPGCQVTIDRHLPLYKENSSRTHFPYLWLACKIMSYILCSFYLFVFMKNDYSTVWNNEYSSDRKSEFVQPFLKLLTTSEYFCWNEWYCTNCWDLLCFVSLPTDPFKKFIWWCLGGGFHQAPETNLNLTGLSLINIDGHW